MHQNSHHSSDGPSIGGGVNALHLIANCYSTCFTVFMRSGFGTEALGVHGIGAAVLILFGMAWGGDVFLAFFCAWLSALVVQRVRTAKQMAQGHIEHSRYAGWPELALKLFPMAKTELQAKAAEPILCGVAAALMATLSPPLGMFIGGGGISLLVVRGIEMQVNKMRVQRMRDAEIEHRQLAMRFRGELKEY